MDFVNKIKILRVDLTQRKIFSEEKTDECIQTFLGGRGLNRWILLNEVVRNTKAFDSQNKLVIGTGLFVGTTAPGASRVQVDTISPYNNGTGSANGGGFFASKLRFAGWDNIIIEGKSEQPVYIFIRNQHVDILDAYHIWGKTTWQTHDLLQMKHGKKISVMSIGPAGENKVYSAAIIIDRYRAAARCGVGAVMGSKNLKAVVVEGNGRVIPCQIKRFRKKSSQLTQKVKKSRVGRGLKKAGTAQWVALCNSMSWNTVNNFQDSYADPQKIESFFPENWVDIKSKSINTCSKCPVDCGFLLKVIKGEYKGAETASAEADAFIGFSAKLGIYDPAVTIKAHEICNKYGLDNDSVSTAISWAYECYEKGILNLSDTDGLDLSWGNDKALITLLKKIALREGFGDILAEGCQKASEKIGRGSDEFCLHVKGQDLIEPIRVMKGWALGVIVSPRAGTHTRGAPETEAQGLTEEEGIRYYGVSTAGNPLKYEGKAKLVIYFERLMAICDSLGLCTLLSEWKGYSLPGMSDYAELLSAYIGREISVEELIEIGERIVTLEKYFNQIHTNFDRSDDYPPDRFLNSPVQSGPLKGEKLHKQKWDLMLDEYYDLHKWSKSTGKVPKKRLKELGILLDVST